MSISVSMPKSLSTSQFHHHTPWGSHNVPQPWPRQGSLSCVSINPKECYCLENWGACPPAHGCSGLSAPCCSVIWAVPTAQSHSSGPPLEPGLQEETPRLSTELLQHCFLHAGQGSILTSSVGRLWPGALPCHNNRGHRVLLSANPAKAFSISSFHFCLRGTLPRPLKVFGNFPFTAGLLLKLFSEGRRQTCTAQAETRLTCLLLQTSGPQAGLSHQL